MRPRIFRVFGLGLASEYPFKNRLAAGEPPAEVTFRCASEPVLELEKTQTMDLDDAAAGRDENPSRFYRLGECDVLRFTEVADYYVSADRIDCHLRDPSREYLVEIELLGPTLSFYLERRGIPTLHGSAVEVAGRAVGFLASKNGGKTGLAAGLMRQGHALLTDDILPIEERQGEFIGRRGYPQMRMWPDQAALYLENWQELDRIHPEYSKRRIPVGLDGLGSFCDSPRPLACIYLPERRSPDAPGRTVEIEQLKSRAALVELLCHAFSPYIVNALGLQAGRLDLFDRLIREVPVRKIRYPSGFEHLPAVCDAILRDVRG